MTNSSKRPGWIYVLPGTHLFVALFAVIGLFVRQDAIYPGRAWDLLYFVDFPLSLGTVFLVFGPQALAAAWVVVVCTWWWYVLSLGFGKAIHWIKLFVRQTKL